ncbi:MAG: hypothetical protein GF355_17190 [Candidatus Eisenbacteria bacterium]|nr:hypothetical protein [Candidatus Eisenbacteria bacterium]
MDKSVLLGMHLGAIWFAVILPGAATAGDIDPADYAPTIAYPMTQNAYPVGMTAIPRGHEEGNDVEKNWELYEPGHQMPPQDFVVSTYVTSDADLQFLCDDNPAGEFNVIEYHFYYARDEKPVFSHEHDWEWIYVIVLDVEDCGQLPFAVSLSSHDPDNHTSEIWYYPWVPNARHIEVQDGTHPVVYVDDGNAFRGDPEGGETYDWCHWSGIATLLQPEDGSLAYASCDEDGPVDNDTIAYGVTGNDECKDPREPPWLRAHWRDPFLEGQLSNHSADVCEVFCGDWCCGPRCTWGMLRYCRQKPYHHFGNGPRGWRRPMGLFTSLMGQRLFWEDWDPAAELFEVLRRNAGATAWDTVAVLSDSAFIDIDPGDLQRRQYRIQTRNGESEPSRITRRMASRVARIQSAVGVGTPLVQIVHCEPWVFAVNQNGYLLRFRVTPEPYLLLEATYDLRTWDLYEDEDDLPVDLVTTEVDLPPWGTVDLLLSAIPNRGTALFRVDGYTGSVSFQSLGGPDSDELAAFNDRIFAAEDDGLSSWKTACCDGGDVFLEETAAPFSPGDCLPECRSVRCGPLEDQVCAVFNPDDDVADRLYVLDASEESGFQIVGVLSGCPPTASCDPFPMKWDIEDVDGDEGRVLLRDVSGHHDYALVDVSVPSVPVYLGAWGNDLFDFVTLVAHWDGEVAALLPGGYLLRGGEVLVAYGSELRNWGGFEIYRSPLWDDPYGFVYVSALSARGFDTLQGLDLIPIAVETWPGPEGTRVLATYMDPMEDTGSSGHLVLYEMSSDLPAAHVQSATPLPDAPVADIRIAAPSPHPAVGSCRFQLTLGRAVEATVRIHGPDGRCVRRLLQGRLEAGGHSIAWDGCDQRGLLCAPGIYFLSVASPAGVQAGRKLVFLR